ncbi:MAG: MBOAT family protein [Clostridia bacterium]|nr:MBOAT family protein [Clostridia bacterium]
MVFSSISFLFYFLPIVLLIYYIIPNKFKNTVLLLASIFFYFYGEPKFIIVMTTSILSTYIFGILINKYKNHSKLLLLLSIFINLSFLIYFKYINFIIENINLYLTNKIDFFYVALPIGISFYTFQLISYLIDVYKKNANVQKNIFKLALYISLFPQLIAGPIIRYTDIENQLDNRTHSFEKFALGVRKFIIGLGKKVLIANILGQLSNIFLNSNDISVLFYWLFGISNMLQIYFDFSGYSDMAIGLGKMFGFDFLENFNYPYIATSITDFWRRWHISLSSWFKDYVYIPLGGNRVNKIKWIRNIFVVWFLTGIWHGANWNFIIWGLYFGVLLFIEKIFLEKFLTKLPKFLSRIYVLFIVMISFIIFSIEDSSKFFNIISGLFGINNNPIISLESLYYFKSYLVILIIGIIGSTPIPKNLINRNNKFINIIEPIFLLTILIISTSFIINSSYNPFLYFRF